MKDDLGPTTTSNGLATAWENEVDETRRATLGADVGGRDAHNATNASILSFRRSLERFCKSSYGERIKEIAIVLRIDGSVQAWGRTEAANASFKKRSRTMTVDAFFSASDWFEQDTEYFDEVLADRLLKAVEQMIEYCSTKGTKIDADRLRIDFKTAANAFRKAI